MAAPGQDLGDLGQAMINAYAGGASNDAVVAYLFQSIVGRAATQQEVQTYTGMIGSSFETAGDLFAHAALLSLNTGTRSPASSARSCNSIRSITSEPGPSPAAELFLRENLGLGGRGRS